MGPRNGECAVVRPMNSASAHTGLNSPHVESPAKAVGLLDIFKIGIGPSSSHTMGPMTAANNFVGGLATNSVNVARIKVTVFGSLAWTGKGHWTDRAITLGLAGKRPSELVPRDAQAAIAAILQSNKIVLPSGQNLCFDFDRDIVFDHHTRMPSHPNAMAFEAYDTHDKVIASETWYSIGGGFVVREGAHREAHDRVQRERYQITTALNLLEVAEKEGLTFADIAALNENCIRSSAETDLAIQQIVEVMFESIEQGLSTSGELPGGLKVKRRAQSLYENLQRVAACGRTAPDEALRYVAAFAIAVNEENAAGHRIVTAPTNGAAGVVPAVLRYYRDFCDHSTVAGIRTFLLTASLIGSVIKRNASISGAEVGCQGEVGSAAAMAAAGLTAALGGTNAQVENAAEIAIEHHLGMTCDPVAGLVQIPCIERNAFGAVKAVTASSLALQGNGEHRVSLDQAIETMRQTGADMNESYRETSRGGLAVNVPEC